VSDQEQSGQRRLVSGGRRRRLGRGRYVVMMTVRICAGSSCHLRGTYQIIEVFKRIIEEQALQNQVELKGCFCMGRCTDGVNMEIDGRALTGIKPEEAADVFQREVIDPLKERPAS
ncbi:MAG: (2Fe-2S) ferredoxin domain-containing protein, partial [bacterium]|nr:(2Fe-2S) ferredoxin domain-containing protein [bacterium]